MKRVTHVVVFGIDEEGKQADWLMPLEEFAKLFTYGETYKMGPNGFEGVSHELLVRCEREAPLTVPSAVAAAYEAGFNIRPAPDCAHCAGKGYHGQQWCACTAAVPERGIDG